MEVVAYEQFKVMLLNIGAHRRALHGQSDVPSFRIEAPLPSNWTRYVRT